MIKVIRIVAVEGLDGAGKSTFVKTLTNNLKKMAPRSLHVESHHFPDFTLPETGKYLKDFLFFEDHSNLSKLKRAMVMFAKNRREWFDINYERLSKYKESVVISDRYRLSNDFLNAVKFNNVKKVIADSHDYELNGLRVYPEIMNIVLTISEELQLKRLSEKDNKDKNETVENVKFVRSKFNQVMEILSEKQFQYPPIWVIDADKFVNPNEEDNSGDLFVENVCIVAAELINSTFRNTSSHRFNTEKCTWNSTKDSDYDPLLRIRYNLRRKCNNDSIPNN